MNKTNTSRRHFLQIASGVGCGLLIPGVAHAGNIHSLDGDVFINRRKANANSTIKSGDLITTSSNGTISFSVGNDAFLLKPFTSLEVEATSSFFISSLRLLTGKLLSVFETGRDRKIVTAQATIGIRGTACFLNANPKSLYYCNCYGKTHMSAKDFEHDFEATHHNAHLLEFEGKKMMGMAATAVLDHTDDELRMLEGIVGRIPKFDQ